MKGTNRVYIATSLDGFIADKNGSVGWLNDIPNPESGDMGYGALMAQTDALLMGRNSFETVLGFGIEWPYTVPVYVLSQTIKEIPDDLKDKVSIVSGSIYEVLQTIHANGHLSLYIDGGRVIQSFLKEDLIDEMVITTIPILLGEGIPLFGHLKNPLKFRCVMSTRFTDDLAQNHYVRI